MTLPVFLGPVAGVAAGDRGASRATRRVTRWSSGVSASASGSCSIDGAGTSATCAVTETAKASLVASVESVAVTSAPAPHVTVVQAIPKGDRAELAVEVLTEIGVDRIVPWAAARCIGTWRGSGPRGRWPGGAPPPVRRQAVAACVVPRGDLAGDHRRRRDLVAGRGRPRRRAPRGGGRPAVVGVARRESAASSWSSDPRAGSPTRSWRRSAPRRVVRMGESVLRTSTAGIAAVAALLSRTPRWH